MKNLGIIGVVFGTAGLACFLTIGYNSFIKKTRQEQECIESMKGLQEFTSPDLTTLICKAEASEEFPDPKLLYKRIEDQLIEIYFEREDCHKILHLGIGAQFIHTNTHNGKKTTYHVKPITPRLGLHNEITDFCKQENFKDRSYYLNFVIEYYPEAVSIKEE
jgi:hypothetical protein